MGGTNLHIHMYSLHDLVAAEGSEPFTLQQCLDRKRRAERVPSSPEDFRFFVV
jgi:hypothetical protein